MLTILREVGRLTILAVLMLLIGTAFCKPASAQTFRGTIVGTVSDPSGAVIAGAKVTAKNTATGQSRETQSAGDGTYAIPELQIGLYDVTAAKNGFETAVAKGASVEIARDRRVDFTLKPGDIGQRIVVTEESASAVETTNNNLGGSFESKDVVDLPINGRDIDKLYIMAPGVTGDPSGAGGAPGSYGQFSANGNRDRANNFLLDGTDMNDSYRNLPAINQGGVFAIPATVLPIEAIAELRILTNFDAEYGRSSGAVVNIVTKSGSNDFHGSVFEYFRNSVLNARNFFASGVPKDAFRNNQFGGSVGGPVIKDKTFFYFAYEGQREGLGLTSVNTVPSLADYQVAIAAAQGSPLGTVPPGCATSISTCVATNVGSFNPVIQNLYNLCNSKGTCSGGKLPWPTASVSSDKSRNDVNSLIFKMDHSFNSNNTLSGRYYYGQSEQSLPLGTGGGGNLPNTNTFSPTNVNLVSISLVTVLSTSKVNEGRFGYNRFHEAFQSADASVFGNPATSLGLNTGLGTVTNVVNSTDFGLPQINVLSGLSQLGSSRFANPRERIDRNYQFVDNFSWKVSRHDIKFGYEYRHTSIDSLQDLNFRGRLKFADLTGFLEGNSAGSVTAYINYGDTRRNTIQDSHAFYLQDSIRLTSRVTANLGVRWDYFGVIHEASNLISNYDPATGLSPQSQPYPRDFNNFAPRLGLAWDVTGKGRTVVRAGFGVFYDSFSHDFFTGQLFEATNNPGPAYNAVGPKPVFQGLAIPGPLAVGVPVFDTSAAALGADTFDASTVGNLRTPYVYNYTLNIQHQLFSNTVLQVGYVGTGGRKLQRIVDLNQPSQAAITASDVTCVGGLGNPPAQIPLSAAPCNGATTVQRNFNNSGSTFLLPGQNNNAAVMSALAPFTPFYLQQLQTSASSTYHSLQVSLTQRNWHGITQQINYTWSHSIDDASDGQDYVPHSGQPNDSTNPHVSNRGNSNFDTRHHFVWALTYSFPKWESFGRMGRGWMVSSVVTLLSGHPVELVNSNDDYDGSGEFFGRPDLVGPVHYNFSNPNQYLNVSAFAVPCTLDGAGGTSAADCLAGTRHFGTLARNSLIGPAFRQWDFSLIKDTRLSERFNLQVRADVYNILNHPNFSNPLLPSFFDDLAGFPVTATGPQKGQFSGFFPIAATVDTGIGNPILGGGGPRSIQFAMKVSF
jgi:outer membrane receptor protein involved in Fe transport